MIIIRKSMATGITHHREVDVTHQQMGAYERGILAQSAFPHLPKEEVEYIISGTTPEEWLVLYPPEKKEGEDPEEKEET